MKGLHEHVWVKGKNNKTKNLHKRKKRRKFGKGLHAHVWGKGKSNNTKNVFEKRHKGNKVGKGPGAGRPTRGRDRRLVLDQTNKQKKHHCSGPEEPGDGRSREGMTAKMGKEAREPRPESVR